MGCRTNQETRYSRARALAQLHGRRMMPTTGSLPIKPETVGISVTPLEAREVHVLPGVHTRKSFRREWLLIGDGDRFHRADRLGAIPWTARDGVSHRASDPRSATDKQDGGQRQEIAKRSGRDCH